MKKFVVMYTRNLIRCTIAALFIMIVLSDKKLNKMEGLIEFGDTSCVPTAACRGIDYDTIPYISDHVHENILEYVGKFYDTRKTRACLAGKRLLLLGDSVMEEVNFDLAILLSGVAKSKDKLSYFVRDATSQDIHADHSQYKILSSDYDVTMHYSHGRRNTTIIDNDIKTIIRHRFTGHASLRANNMGIDTFFHEAFQQELHCLLGFTDHPDCPKPDIIILNSGLHDHKAEEQKDQDWQKDLNKFLTNLREHYKKLKKGNVRIVWKGNLVTGQGGTAPHLQYLNDKAQETLDQFGIPFVNITKILTYVPRHNKKLDGLDGGIDMYTPDGIHYGTIGRSKDSDCVGTVSMLITQTILNDLCETKKGNIVDKWRRLRT